MHEMSLAESVMQIIEDNALSSGFTRVKTVWLEIGELAGVEVEAMKFCFDAVTRNSLAEGARLIIISTEGTGRCPICNKTMKLKERFDPCPECGCCPVEVTGGTEMRIRELEVE